MRNGLFGLELCFGLLLSDLNAGDVGIVMAIVSFFLFVSLKSADLGQLLQMISQFYGVVCCFARGARLLHRRDWGRFVQRSLSAAQRYIFFKYVCLVGWCV
jgi:hypothetical protein